jgi:alkylated DNA nucleotide flippase Atl1
MHAKRGLQAELRRTAEFIRPGRIVTRYRQIAALIRLHEAARGVSLHKMLETVIAFDDIQRPASPSER